MAKLYEISDRYKNLDELLDNPELEDAKEAIRKALDGVNEEFDTKAENIAKLISALNSDIDGMAKEIKRLQVRKSVTEHRVDDLKNYIYEHMKVLNKKKIKGALFTLSIQKNSPSVSVIDEGAVPGQYKIPQPPKLDKKAILTDLKQGVEVNGTEIKQGTSLRIR